MKLHVVIATVVLAFLASACGPWSRDTQCVSGVHDWTGCVPSSDETQAFLKKEGYGAFPPPTIVVIVAPTPMPIAPAQPTAPVVPTVQPVPLPTATPIVPAAEPAGCHVINDYDLIESMDHVSTSGSHLHVEYWWEGQPERETLLRTTDVAGGRYNLTRPLKGHVWEYADCTDQRVMEQINAHILRRKAGGANNAGFVDWQSTGLFQPTR